MGTLRKRAGLLLAVGASYGCAGVPEGVALLAEEPERPYREIARLEASGRIGAPRAGAYERLRREAARLGADAVLKTGEERKYRRATPPETLGNRASLGDAYPDAAEVFRPGFFGYEGGGVATVAGYYWQVEGVALDLE
ncbi:MAG TPA: hypothetical protein VFZ84_20255 [Burkholderiales bacterium]